MTRTTTQIRRATDYIALEHALAWEAEGADPARLSLPRSALRHLAGLVRRALQAANQRLPSSPSPAALLRQIAERTAGQVLAYLDATRAALAGARGYVWVRTTSRAPRREHLQRVGKFYRWTDDHDHPGEAWGCKCSTRPIFG